jgi:RNA polymerase sigma factor (sigma-70 family)
MGLSTKKLMTLVQSSQDLLSLDMMVGESGGVTLGGLIRDRNISSDPENLVLDQEMIAELQRILSELNDREQRVMRLRFRLDGAENPVQEDIAKEMKLSRERVRQIEVQAIKKLRALAHRHRLRDMLNQ